MELDKFHVFYGSLSPVYHRYAVAGSDERIGRGLINSAHAAGRHEGDFGEECIYLTGFQIEHISSVTFDVGSLPRNGYSEMVLRKNLDGEMLFENSDVGVLFDSPYQTVLNFRTRVILVVQDAKFGMSAFPVKVEFPFFVFIEIDPPADEFFDLRRSFFYDFLDCGAVAEPVAGDHRVFDMFLKVVYQRVGYRGYATLCEIGICLLQFCFAYERHFSFVCYFQGKTHSGYPGTDD